MFVSIHERRLRLQSGMSNQALLGFAAAIICLVALLGVRRREQRAAMEAALARVAEAHDVAHHMAHHDAPTGLPNRVLFYQRVDTALAGFSNGEPAFSVLCFDLDRFKAVNDEFGHAGGDELLGSVAQRLLADTPEKGTVARLGGDEFAMLVFDNDGIDAAEDVAARIIVRLAAPHQLMTGRVEVGVSVGISSVDRSSTRDGLIGRADQALYEAKRAGRGTFRTARCGEHQHGSDLYGAAVDGPPTFQRSWAASDGSLFPSSRAAVPT